jgi:putative acetyltransferase
MTGMAPAWSIAPERAADTAAIRTVLAAAFGRPDEAELVERLRASGDLVCALVARDPGRELVGYVAGVKLQVETAAGPQPAVGIAPLAISPTHQRRGVGSALVRHALAELAKRGETLVLVLGDPAFYRRFGFDAAFARSFESAYPGPHFLALPLAAHAPRSGQVTYPPAFAGL